MICHLKCSTTSEYKSSTRTIPKPQNSKEKPMMTPEQEKRYREILIEVERVASQPTYSDAQERNVITDAMHQAAEEARKEEREAAIKELEQIKLDTSDAIDIIRARGEEPVKYVASRRAK